MAEIIPVLNVKTLKGLEKSLDIFKKYRGWFQLDVADGKFTAWKNFHDIGKIKLLKIKNPLEIHLMIDNPEKNLEDWIFLKPKRLILQLEAIKDLNLLQEKEAKIKFRVTFHIEKINQLEVIKKESKMGNSLAYPFKHQIIEEESITTSCGYEELMYGVGS